MSAEARYVPAAGRAAFTRLYDPALALTMRERHFRGLLLARLTRGLPLAGTVIDVGCGTGSFAIDVANARRDAEVIGVDGDSEMLAAAQEKPRAERVSWRAGLAGELPFADGSVDAVVMSLLLHHLDAAGKTAALADASRVLRPGGRLHIADWGRPHDPLMRGAFLILQMLDGFPNTRDHAAGRLPNFIVNAGFEDLATHARLRTAWGSLDILTRATPARRVGRASRSASLSHGCGFGGGDHGWPAIVASLIIGPIVMTPRCGPRGRRPPRRRFVASLRPELRSASA